MNIVTTLRLNEPFPEKAVQRYDKKMKKWCSKDCFLEIRCLPCEKVIGGRFLFRVVYGWVCL